MKNFKWRYLLIGACALAGLYFIMGMPLCNFLITYKENIFSLSCFLVMVINFVMPITLIPIVADVLDGEELDEDDRIMIIMLCGTISFLTIIILFLGKYCHLSAGNIITGTKISVAPNLIIVLYNSIRLSLEQVKE